MSPEAVHLVGHRQMSRVGSLTMLPSGLSENQTNAAS